MKTFSKLLCVSVLMALTACGGGGGGGSAAAINLTTDANGRVGAIPANVTILPSNAQ